MPLNASSYCPGGTGKKVKHCDCRDISGDLEAIVRALEGGQRVAGLNHINRLLATKASRPCLLTLKILTLMDMNERQALEETVATFLQVAPENVLAHTFSALLEVRKHNAKAAVEHLQDALERATDVFPGELYDAIGAVAQVLAAENDYLAARAHLLFRAVIGPKDERSLEPLVSLTQQARVPTLAKRELMFGGDPGGQPWRDRFEEAMQRCSHGAWRATLTLLEQLDRDYPGQPLLLENIAVANSYLGRSSARDAWRAFARAEGVDEASAVEAEALAQLLDHSESTPSVGLVKLTVPVRDANALLEKMLSCTQLVNRTMDLTQTREEGTPPPKAVFQILNRPMPEPGAELTLDNVPRTLTQTFLYGRETDREARLETVLPKTEIFDQACAILEQVGGELLASEGRQEEILDTIPLDMVELFPQLWFSPETPYPDRRRIADAAVSRAFTDKWPQLPLAALDDKTPREVADNPAYSVRVKAALLALEQLAELQSWPVDASQLYTTLGITPPATLDPTTCRPEAVPPHRLHRLDVGKLTDEQLVNCYQRAALFGGRNALHLLGEEILRRDTDTLRKELDLASICGDQAGLVGDADVALTYLQRAKEYAARQGTSPAQWYLSELPLHLLRGDGQAAQKAIQVLQTRHMQEPGVAQALMSILVRFGIVTPDGRLASEAAQPAAAPAAPAEPSQVWTPAAASAAGTAEPKESKLWLPGMD